MMMGHRCCGKQKVKRGLWSPEEDEKLLRYITSHGHSSWSSVPKFAGLQRCGKSCRLRWINYLRPDLRRGSFTAEEEQIIIDVHRILGNRWAQIAKHLPGRTDNEVKNFWNSCIKKKLMSQGLDPRTHNLMAPHKRASSSPSDNSKATAGTKSKTKPHPPDHDTFSIITLNPPHSSLKIKPSHHSHVTTASPTPQHVPTAMDNSAIPPNYDSSSMDAAMAGLFDESYPDWAASDIGQQFQQDPFQIIQTQAQEHGDSQLPNNNVNDESINNMDVSFDISCSFDPDFAALFSSAMSSDFNPMEWTFN